MANAIRALAMDAVQQANSGHPGLPMGAADVATVLFNQFLKFDPADPKWPDRDRFVLSNGHASILLYSLIHLAGVKNRDEHGNVTDEPSLPLEQLQKFRQLGSRTPGHPEQEATSGVETTTGPLGQGVGNAVGMAIAQKWTAAYYGRPGFESLFDHRVYAICGDGCMMEGVASEAASLAGHLRLSNLCWIYDSNRISIEGSTELAFTEDVGTRFLGLGWNVVHLRDANDTKGLARALRDFDREQSRPTMIIVESHIGYGAPHRQDPGQGAAGDGAADFRRGRRLLGIPVRVQPGPGRTGRGRPRPRQGGRDGAHRLAQP